MYLIRGRKIAAVKPENNIMLWITNWRLEDLFSNNNNPNKNNTMKIGKILNGLYPCSPNPENKPAIMIEFLSEFLIPLIK